MRRSLSANTCPLFFFEAFKDSVFRDFTLDGHFIMRLKDVRTSELGIKTFKDLETMFRRGVVENADDGAIAIVYNGMAIIVNPLRKVFVTLRPWR